MSERDIFESFGAFTEQYQDEIEENLGVGEASLAGAETSRGTPNWLQLAFSGQHDTLCNATSVDRKFIEGLSPIQNEWIRRYTRPGITVNLPLWAEQQPENFSLKYLLSHALESGWDLTGVGWDKAYELEVAQRFEELEPDAPSEYEGWWTTGEAADQLYDRLDHSRTKGYFKSLLFKRAEAGTIKTNGKKGRERRYLPEAVMNIALDIIEYDIKKYEEEQRRLGFNV